MKIKIETTETEKKVVKTLLKIIHIIIVFIAFSLAQDNINNRLNEWKYFIQAPEYIKSTVGISIVLFTAMMLYFTINAVFKSNKTKSN